MTIRVERSCFVWAASISMAMGLCALFARAEPRVTGGSPAATRPTTSQPAVERSSTTRPAKTRKPDVIKTAIGDLTREASAAIARKEAFPRDTPDYFSDKEVVIDPKELIRALARPISSDPRIDAYIKLQLLSGVEQLEGDDAAGALDAYIKGVPQLIPVPNAQRDRQTWDMKKLQAKEADVERINAEFLEWRAPFEERNATTLAYRDALCSRINPSDELKPKWFKARVEDLSQRCEAGFEPTKEWSALAKEIHAWSQLAPKKAISDMVGFLNEYTKRTGADFYEKLVWSDRSSSAYWRDRPGRLDKRKLEKLIEGLKTAEQNAL